jgi:hypothetical protein
MQFSFAHRQPGYGFATLSNMSIFFAGACKIRHIQDTCAPDTTEHANKATDFPETWVGVTATGSQKILGLKKQD